MIEMKVYFQYFAALNASKKHTDSYTNNGFEKCMICVHKNILLINYQ